MLRSSYVHGASETPLIGETIGQHVDRIVARYPEHPAVVVRHQDVRWSYAEFNSEVEALAAGLVALGLKVGDRIGIWSQNNVEWILTQFATAKAGLILVNINPAYRAYELEYAITKAGCTALILAPAFKSSDYLEILQSIAPELAHCAPGRLDASRLPTLRSVIRLGPQRTPGMYNFAEVATLGSDQHTAEIRRLADVLQFDDPINIQFTSGTTGNPKGATLTQHPQQWLFRRRGHAIDRKRSPVHPGSVLPLLRHGAWQSRLPDAWRLHGHPE